MFVTSKSRWSKFQALAPIVFAALGCAKLVPAKEADDTQEGIDPSAAGSDDGAECSTHADCGHEQICDAGQCVPNESGGPCDIDLNCIDGEICDIGQCMPEGPTTTDMACGGDVYPAKPVPPNVLIVLDRSGSMEDELGNSGSSKWEVAQDAVGQVVSQYDDEVRFGLSLYPGIDPACVEGGSCSQGAVFVEIGLGTAEPITDMLATVDTCSLGTPTAEALEPLVDYTGLEDPDRGNFVLLITDGKSTCADPVPIVAALHAETPQIETFVVGFGTDADPNELDDMAQAGGTALEGDPKYYQADDAEALVEAFGKIAGSVISCVYVLEMVPPDPQELYVYINGMKVARDPMHQDGWDYESQTNQISFYGPACELLQSGEGMGVEIIFGCPENG